MVVIMKNVAPEMREQKYHMRKVLNPGKGYPCVFRQHLAQSHCNLLHGYDLVFEIEMSCYEHDRTMEGWVFDFGEFKELKLFLDSMFDHTCLVSQSDPEIEVMRELHQRKLIDLREVQDTGCEAFAFMVWAWMSDYVRVFHPTRKSLKVPRVTVRENDSNSASYTPPPH